MTLLLDLNTFKKKNSHSWFRGWSKMKKWRSLLLPATTLTCTSTRPPGDACTYHPKRKHSLTFYGGLYLHSWLHSCAKLRAPHRCRLKQVSVWSHPSTGCWYLGVDLTNRATMLITHINWCSFEHRFKFLPVPTLIKFHQWLLNDFNRAWFWRSIIQIDDLVVAAAAGSSHRFPLCVLTVLLGLGSDESSILLS